MAGCREEKIKRALRQQKHASAASETASDRSRTDRDSAELKQGSFTLPLAAAPERGILKKGMSHGSISGTKSSQPARPLLAAASANVDSLPSTEDDRNRQQLMSPTAGSVVSDAADSNGFEFIDEDGSCCSCSCDEVEAVGDQSSADGIKTSDCAGTGGCSVETQTDPESLASSRTSLYDPGEKMTRLCNINELLRQIDEQFNSVLRATSMTLPDTAADLSPTNSEDMRGSETEADRACLSYFARSDAAGAGQPHTSSSDTKLAEAERVTEPSVRPIIKPVPLVPHRLNPGSDMAGASRCPQNVRVPMSASYHGAPTVLSAQVPTNRLLSCTAPPVATGTSSSPATVASEGYHSDRLPPAEVDVPVIIREIPKSSTTLVNFPTDSNKQPQSKHLNSPDDVNI